MGLYSEGVTSRSPRLQAMHATLGRNCQLYLPRPGLRGSCVVQKPESTEASSVGFASISPVRGIYIGKPSGLRHESRRIVEISRKGASTGKSTTGKWDSKDVDSSSTAWMDLPLERCGDHFVWTAPRFGSAPQV